MRPLAAYQRGRQIARTLRAPAARRASERNSVDDGRNRLAFRLQELIADTPGSEVPVQQQGTALRTAWTNATLARARDGSRERMGGWSTVHTAGHPGVDIGKALHAVDREQTDVPFFLSWGSNGIYASDGTAWFLIDATASPPPGAVWWQDMHGYTITGGVGVPQQLDWSAGLPTSLDVLTGWPTLLPAWECDLICRFENFLIAFGLSEDGTYFPDQVVWSDAADPGTLPAEWQPAPTNLAGFATLTGDGSWRAAAQLGDVCVAYREGETWIGRYIELPYVFDWRRRFPNRGAQGPDAVAAVEGFHFVVSDRELGYHDGVNWQSVSTGRVRRWLRARHADNLLRRGCGRLVYYPDGRELWYTVPTDAGEGICEEALIFNLDSGDFTFRPLPQGVYGFAVGTVVADNPRPGDWESDLEAWEDDPTTWEGDDEALGNVPVAVCEEAATGTANSKFLRAYEIGDTADGSPQSWTLQRLSLDLGDAQAVDTVVQVWPRVADLGSGCYIDVRVGSQMTDRDPVAWGPTARLAFGQEKVDVLATGRYISVELSSDCTDLVRVEGFDLVFSRGGYG